MKIRSVSYLFILITGFASLAAAASDSKPGIIRYDAIHHPVIARHGMVVSQREIASQAGADMLAAGGNAVDAAVATGFALAVTLPRAGNLGGGGFMLVHLSESHQKQPGQTIALDYREQAPALAHRDMFLDANGNVDNELARRSARSAGIPGTVAGLLHALDTWGTLPRKVVLAPAIELAKKGFPIPWDLSEILKQRREMLGRHPATRSAFYKPDGTAFEAGEILRQPDLAKTLQRIAKDGADGFYQGKTARLIATEMERSDGIISKDDLKNYQFSVRKPIVGNYRDVQVVSMPPSSSGGIHIVQMLNVLNNFPLAEYGSGSAVTIHLMAETMKYAYADRAEHLGDMDFHPVPVEWLTGNTYANTIAKKINPNRATPSSQIKAGQPAPVESPDTTHFSVVDQFGNAVANTYTLNFSFGSGLMVTGAGFLLNNEMDDFSAKPGTPNGFGLLGNEANAIAPGKRPLSSMTPTMLFKDGKPFVVTGSPGGSRIITTVLQQIVNVVDFEMNIAAATAAPRFHHQWLPDRIQVEPGISPDTIQLLRQRGHMVETAGTQGSLQSIMVRDGLIFGAADPRRPGAGAVGVNF